MVAAAGVPDLSADTSLARRATVDRGRPADQGNARQRSPHIQQIAHYGQPQMEDAQDRHNKALGRAIRQLRKKVGLTQQQLADLAQLPVPELRQIEHGGIEADWGTVRHLAKEMEVSLADVFRLTDELEARG
jgi:DNA-binding XRE family transcriptional regulator